MNQNNLPKREITILTLGEIAVGVIIAAVFLLIKKFNYTVALGSLLGGAVTVFNFVFLSIAVNRAIDDAMKVYEQRQKEKATQVSDASDTSADSDDGETDPYDDEAAKFARENAAKITNAVKVSYIVRTASVVITLAVAFITKQFNVIATVIPLLCMRPLLTVSELLKKKGGES